MLQDTAPAEKRYMSYEFTQMHGSVTDDDYERGYTGKIAAGATAEDALDVIYAELNAFHPADYHHRGLSVSDVVVLTDLNRFWFEGWTGFRKIFQNLLTYGAPYDII